MQAGNMHFIFTTMGDATDIPLQVCTGFLEEDMCRRKKHAIEHGNFLSPSEYKRTRTRTYTRAHTHTHIYGFHLYYLELCCIDRYLRQLWKTTTLLDKFIKRSWQIQQINMRSTTLLMLMCPGLYWRVKMKIDPYIMQTYHPWCVRGAGLWPCEPFHPPLCGLVRDHSQTYQKRNTLKIIN